MNRDYYKNLKNRVTTSISGGRPHFTTRPRFLRVGFTERICRFGDNYYGLSDERLGSDKLWDMLADVNLPQYPEDLAVGRIIEIPTAVVEIENTDFTVL